MELLTNETTSQATILKWVWIKILDFVIIFHFLILHNILNIFHVICRLPKLVFDLLLFKTPIFTKILIFFSKAMYFN